MSLIENGKLRIDPKLINEHFLPYIWSNAREELFFGGGGSGKSYFLAQRDIIDVLTKPECNKLILRKVSASNHNSTFSDLISIISKWRLDALFHINNSMGGERIYAPRTKSEIIFSGCKDENELEKIKGVRARSGPIVHIRMEELGEFNERDYNQLNNVRLRGETKIRKRMTGSMNPVMDTHWAKKRFIDNAPEDSYHFEHGNSDRKILESNPGLVTFKTTHLDNDFYGEDERNYLLKLKYQDKYQYDVYVLGNWGVLGNLVFSNFIIEDFSYEEDDLENVCNGIDFGYVHASAFIRCGFREDELYIFDELYGKGWTNTDFIDKALEYYGDESKYWDITCDSAEPDRIEEWERAGFRMIHPAKKGKGSLKYGIDYLVSKRIHINKSKCPNTAREIQSFKRREDSDGNVMDDFVELGDDCLSATRYGTEFIWSNETCMWNPSGYGLSDIGI